MWVWSLSWEDPLEEEMATHSSILARRIPWTEEPGGLTGHGVTKSRTWLRMEHEHARTSHKYNKMWMNFCILFTSPWPNSLRARTLSILFKCLDTSAQNTAVFLRMAVTKYHRLRGFNSRHLFFSQFWRQQVQDQGVGRFSLFWALFSWLVYATFSLRPHVLFASVLILSSYGDTRHTALGSTHVTSFHLNYFFQGPISSPFLRYWGIQHMDF